MPQVSSRAISKSIAGGAVTGASQELFDDVGLRQGQLAGGFNSIIERVIANPSATATLWINPLGGVAVANGAGCLALNPLDRITLNGIVNAINVLGVAGQAITAWER